MLDVLLDTIVRVDLQGLGHKGSYPPLILSSEAIPSIKG
jgi:hypothetical protein